MEFNIKKSRNIIFLFAVKKSQHVGSRSLSVLDKCEVGVLITDGCGNQHFGYQRARGSAPKDF